VERPSRSFFQSVASFKIPALFPIGPLEGDALNKLGSFIQRLHESDDKSQSQNALKTPH